jgi:CCR4-NOT transcription complex subunit 1
VQLLLAPARQAASVGQHQNAEAASRLLQEEDSKRAPGGSGSNGRARLEQRLQQLLSAGVASAVDALPPVGSMAADPGGGSAHWLARAMRELGYSCTANEAAFKGLLKQFPGRLDEATVAEALGLMARTVRGLEPDGLGLAATLAAVLSEGGAPPPPLGEAGSSAWNVGVVIDVLKARAPGLSWRRVAECLDHEGFLVPEPAGLGILTTAFRRATGEGLPVAPLVGRLWNNTAGQLSLLAAATVAPPDAVPWDTTPRRIAPLEGLAGGPSPVGTPNGCWLSVDLLSVLVRLSDAGQAGPVRSLLEAGPGKSCRDVLLASLGALRPPGDTDWSSLERGLWASLLPPVLAGNPNSGLLLRRLWDANPSALCKGMALWTGGDAARVARCVDILQQLGVLGAAMDAAPAELALDMGDAAARRDALGGSLDAWLSERLARQGAPLARGVLRYLEARIAAAPTTVAPPSPDATRASPPQLARDAAACMLRALHSFAALGGGDLSDDLARISSAAAAAYPGSEALFAAAAAVGSGASGGPFPPDVEEEANKQFHAVGVFGRGWEG